MSGRTCSLRRCLFGSLAVAALALLAGRGPASAVTTGSTGVLAQRYYPEVRLRKLHLVRPDLIPFPIDFDVYC